ncbi:hypothetical protein SSBR45G_20840 [Bradyrhizobium sp. SSBR45G]|uniref:putative quinol monooxygenase n=1 Tax=unclassified Bradyrhizobium TaxID=2631580 RepID=UPI0023429D55|nr:MULTISPECIES: putative quinol monooxygenase [unclassified Bradyrhizobium]GLH77176.1 hypothetical protein SSBR45G_20840 [Bradyrhizobium sp. SSBR45G]GLH83934.1 hypothetical protein SSBR45R_13940 [Bradyrhizobium sp. SSBR45R]
MRTLVRLMMAAPFAAIMFTPALAEDHSDIWYAEIPSTAYAVVAEVQAKPGKESALRDATVPLIAKVRAERNNLLYFLQEDQERPGRFVFYEMFRSLDDFEAHNRTPHVQSWFAILDDLADGPVKVTRLRLLTNHAAEISR